MFAYNHYPPPVPANASEATRARCDIRRLAFEANYPAAAKLWLEKKPAPLNPRDALTFAHVLSEIGSPEAAPFIETVRAFSPGEAATLDSMLHLRNGRMPEARASLLEAFAHFRHDAWPNMSVQARAFDLAASLVMDRFDRRTVDSAGQFMTRARRVLERSYGAQENEFIGHGRRGSFKG